MSRAPMQHRDAKTTVEKAVHDHVGWYLRCDHCGKEFLLPRSKNVRKYIMVKGHRTWRFCSVKCKDHEQANKSKGKQILADIIARSKT